MESSGIFEEEDCGGIPQTFEKTSAKHSRCLELSLMQDINMLLNTLRKGRSKH